MKVETKSELRRRIAYLEDVNEKLRDQLFEQQRERWEANIGKALKLAREDIKCHIGALCKEVKFQRVDNSGYWFTFKCQDGQEYSYLVPHSEVKNVDKMV